MKSIKPIPYYTSADSRFHRALAADLRLCFRPAVARRLPAHHMAGQNQGFIPAFVTAHKKLRDIPPGSAMSGILAPVALAPLWLDLKKAFDVKCIVFMDDVLVLCRAEADALAVWEFLNARLHADLGLRWNKKKTLSGKFAEKAVSFCGWRFAGGVCCIS